MMSMAQELVVEKNMTKYYGEDGWGIKHLMLLIFEKDSVTNYVSLGSPKSDPL